MTNTVTMYGSMQLLLKQSACKGRNRDGTISWGEGHRAPWHAWPFGCTAPTKLIAGKMTDFILNYPLVVVNMAHCLPIVGPHMHLFNEESSFCSCMKA